MNPVSRDEPHFTLVVIDTYFSEGKEEMLDHWEHTPLRTRTLEEMQEIVRLANPPAWQIEYSDGGSLSNKAVLKSPNLVAWEERQKSEGEKHNASQLAKLKVINSQPTEVTKYFGAVKVTFTRGEATYNPRRSRAISVPVSIIVGESTFYPKAFITENGRTQWKKLQDNFGDSVGKTLGERIEYIQSVAKQLMDGNYKE